MTTTYFIAGASRGIGYSLVEALSEDSKNVVIGSVRDEAKPSKLIDLAKAKDNVHVVNLDVDKEDSIKGLPAQLSDLTEGIDVFIANAGIGGSGESFLEASQKAWFEVLSTNTVGPILVYQQVHQFMLKRETRKVFFVSSTAGSSASLELFPTAVYGASKAALNFAMKNLAVTLRPERFTFMSLCPGMVLTDMGKVGLESLYKMNPEVAKTLEQKARTPEDGARLLLEQVYKATPETTGKFLSSEGTEIVF